jgi:hypothetical protein
MIWMLGVFFFHVCCCRFNIAFLCIDEHLNTSCVNCLNACHLLGFYAMAIVHLPEVTLSSHLTLAEALKMAGFGILNAH